MKHDEINEGGDNTSAYLSERIEEFRNYCNDQLDAIDKLSVPNYETLFKKKLYISFLESLAKAAFPKERLVNKRFLKFLEMFTNWKEFNHCCPVRLNNEPIKEKILNERGYTTIKNVSIASDECLETKTYAKLLYEARNNMVHELQASIEWEQATKRRNIYSPFYQVTTSFLTEEKYIELVLPNTFLKKLSEDGLADFIKYCSTEQINPFPGYYAEKNTIKVR